MALSNQERQARYRIRLKELAARSELNEVLINTLMETRRHIREWKRSIALLDAGIMHLHINDADVSADHAVHLRGVIATNQRLLDRHDPEGLTHDGNIELAEAPRHLVHERWEGRPVTYRLDAEGAAVILRTFETPAEAGSHAACSLDSRAGTVGDEMWSVVPANYRET